MADRGIRLLNPPLRLRATVVKGFGRGSKLLGIPTANMDMTEIASQLEEGIGVENGVFMGFASLTNGSEIHKTVLSIGWCVSIAVRFLSLFKYLD